jgi:hypothetical protein
MILALALALALAAQSAPYDTVELTNGGLLRGTIVQDVPGEPVLIELPSGEVWTVPRATIVRIERASRAPAGEAVPPETPMAGTPAGMPPPVPAPTPEEAAAAAQAEPLAHVPVLMFGLSTGVAVPLGKLDASGLALGSAVSPMWTLTFELSYRPLPELDLGILTLVGLGTSYDPLNAYCVEFAGAWCDATNVVVGAFTRVNFLPRSHVNPWIMVTGGWDFLSVSNEYQDAFDFSGWQVGAAAGVDLQWAGGGSFGFQVGTRWGEYASLTVKGYLPAIPFQAAMHGWLDLAVRGSFGI